jgi:hypothetical protein
LLNNKTPELSKRKAQYDLNKLVCVKFTVLEKPLN